MNINYNKIDREEHNKTYIYLIKKIILRCINLSGGRTMN